MTREIIVFDIWSDFAHFRRGYTTTSSLTYPFPPKTAIIGLVAGFLGIPNERNEKENYYRIFTPENLKVGIRILNHVKTTIIKENLIDTKLGFLLKGRTQIPIQFLKDPKYRIYLWLSENLKNESEKLIEFLRGHKSFYTPYMGTTECIANFNFIGNFSFRELKKKNDYYEIDSIIPKSVGEIKVEEGKTYGIVRMPAFIDENRQLKLLKEFVYLEDGSPLNEKERNSIRLLSLECKDDYISICISEENVILF
ncbi:MAG: type I-B CRISPR-associated protein Cas5 [Candidatus Omnitrophica bacterium 4484_70.2]|nr:MAG: type I-B CRISPR-associated protein Cas5 [Candidatus Omnitrophica bacterium 4484_70.2]